MSSSQAEAWDLTLDHPLVLETANTRYAEIILDTELDDRPYQAPSEARRKALVYDGIPYYWAGQLPNAPFIFPTGERVRMLLKNPSDNPWSSIASSLNMSVSSAQLKYRFYFDRLQTRTQFDKILDESKQGTDRTPVLESIEEAAKHLYRDRGWKKTDVYAAITHYVEQYDWARRRHEADKEFMWNEDDEISCQLAQKIWLKWKRVLV